MSKYIGQPTPLIDSEDKVTGTLMYGTDLAFPGMLYGRVLRSPYAHARIKSIDTAAAKALPGVYAVVTGRDKEMPWYSVAGVPKSDEQLLAVDKVRYPGDEVAAVSAVDEETAEAALKLIKVEYEELPGVFDLEEAIKEDAPLVHEEFGSNIINEMHIRHGDAEKAFEEAAVVVSGKFYSGRLHHAYIEPNGGIGQWDGDKVNFWLSTQSPVLAQMTYAKALGVQQKQVRVSQYGLGGGFGGKLEYKLHPLCALLSKFSDGRPVKMVNTRQDELWCSLPRVPMQFEIKMCCDAEGNITGKWVRLLADNGAYLNYGIGIMLSAATRNDNLYRIKNIRTDAYLVYTNRMATGAFRGFGCPQSHWAQETLVDEMAEKLGMDPAELRIKNASQQGDVTPHNWWLGSCGLVDCIKQSVEAADWYNKKAEYDKPQEGEWVRGIGLASCLHVSGNRTFLPFFDGSSAYVRIDGEGKVTVFPGEVDLGQGCRTVFAMIVAEELNIPLDWVEVSFMDTKYCPHGMGTFGDRVTTLGGNSVKRAARDARRKLLDFAANYLHTDIENLYIEDGMIKRYDGGSSMDHGGEASFREMACLASYAQAGATVIGIANYQPPNVSVVHPQTKVANVSAAYPFVTQIVELEVSRVTGEIRLLNIVSSHDLGKAINPLIADGQVGGAVAQGIGFGMLETMMEPDGAVRNQSFKHYPICRTTDMPPMQSLLIESNDPNGPYGAKGLGEPALTSIGPAIANAVYDALGVRIRTAPITPEKILAALDEKNKQA